MNNNVTRAVLDVETSMDSDSIIHNFEDDMKRQVYEVLFENSDIFKDISMKQVYIRSIEMDLDFERVKVILDIFDDNDEEMLIINVTSSI